MTLTRRDFLRRTSLALAGGLIVGDAAMELFERLSPRPIFALGQMPRLMDLNLTTNFSAGMFSIFAKPDGGYTGFGKVTIDGAPAEHVTAYPNGMVRVGRYLGDGPITPKGALVMANGVVILKAAQVEEGRFPSSFIATGDKPSTRNADRLTLNLYEPPQGMEAYINGVTYEYRGIDPSRSTPPRFTDTPLGPALLIEGERTNYALHQPLPTEFTR